MARYFMETPLWTQITEIIYEWVLCRLQEDLYLSQIPPSATCLRWKERLSVGTKAILDFIKIQKVATRKMNSTYRQNLFQFSCKIL